MSLYPVRDFPDPARDHGLREFGAAARARDIQPMPVALQHYDRCTDCAAQPRRWHVISAALNELRRVSLDSARGADADKWILDKDGRITGLSFAIEATDREHDEALAVIGATHVWMVLCRQREPGTVVANAFYDGLATAVQRAVSCGHPQRFVPVDDFDEFEGMGASR